MFLINWKLTFLSVFFFMYFLYWEVISSYFSVLMNYALTKLLKRAALNLLGVPFFLFMFLGVTGLVGEMLLVLGPEL